MSTLNPRFLVAIASLVGAAPLLAPKVAFADPNASAMATSDATAQKLELRMAATMARPGGLTAEEVGRAAAATSYDVAARKADIDAAVASVNQTLVSFVPRLSGLFRYQRLSHIDSPNFGAFLAGTTVTPGMPITSTQQLIPVDLGKAFAFPDNATTLQASLTLPISDYVFRLAQSYSAAKHTKEAAVLNSRAAQLKAATDGKSLYYTWVRAKLQSLVAEQALAQSQGHLLDVQHQFDAGAVSRADVLRVESQVASTELLLERARNASLVTEDQLRVAMHSKDDVMLEIGEDLNAPVDAAIGNEAAKDLWVEAISNRLEVRSFIENYDSLKKQSSIARAGSYPVITGIGDLVYANPNQRIIPPAERWDFTWDIGVQATWSPNDVAIADASAKNIQARASSVQAQKQQFQDGLRNEVMQTSSALREAMIAMQTTARGLSASEESYRVRRELFLNGRATSVELTDAETDLTRARFDSINARIDLRVARVRLLHALGRDVMASNDR